MKLVQEDAKRVASVVSRGPKISPLCQLDSYILASPRFRSTPFAAHILLVLSCMRIQAYVIAASPI